MTFIPIELKKDTRVYELQNRLQQTYESDRSTFNRIQKENIENLTGTTIENFSTSSSFLKNQPTIRSQFTHILRDLDLNMKLHQ